MEGFFVLIDLIFSWWPAGVNNRLTIDKIRLTIRGGASILPVENQVVLIYAGSHGYLDDIPASAVNKFEAELYPYIEAKYPDIFEQIRSKKSVEKDIEEKLEKALSEFKATFSAE